MLPACEPGLPRSAGSANSQSEPPSPSAVGLHPIVRFVQSDGFVLASRSGHRPERLAGPAWSDLERAPASRPALSARAGPDGLEGNHMKYRATTGMDLKSRGKVSVLSLDAIRFGAATDRATWFAILDQYAEAGGTFIDTPTITHSGSTASGRGERGSA